jgi:LPS sulfotransferase NodH
MFLQKARRVAAQIKIPFIDYLLPSPPIRFVVLTRGRTGSTYLLSLLESHPRIRVWGEVFGEARLRRHYIKARILANGPVRYLERCFERKGWEAAAGIKIMYRHFETDYALAWGIPELPKILAFLKKSKDLKIIHLKRRNKLKAIVSGKMAAATRQYIVTKEAKRAAGVQIELFPDECEQKFEQIANWEKTYDESFEDHEKLNIYYEDLTADTESEHNRVLDFLGVAKRRLRAKTIKQRVRPIHKVVKNYEELREKFVGTEWEEFFQNTS